MLLVLLSFFFQYELVNCIKYEKAPSFNETHLSEQLHQSLIQVNAFLKDIQHNIHGERSALRTVDYEAITTVDQDFMDYSLTNIWWNGSQATGRNTPLTDFLPTHRDHGSDSDLIFTATPTPIHTTTRERPFYSPYSLPDYVPKFTFDTPRSPPIPPQFTTVFKPSSITRPSFPFSIPTEITTPSWDETFSPGPYPPWHPLYRPPSDTPGPWTPGTRPTERQTSDLMYPPSDYHTTHGKEATEQPSELDHTSWPSLKPPVTSAETKSSGYPWPSLRPPSLTSLGTHRSTANTERLNPDDYTYETSVATSPPTPSVSVLTTLYPNISHYVQEWLKQMTSSKAVTVDEKLLTTTTDSVHTGKPPGTLDNWLPNKRLDQNSSKYLPAPIHRQGPPPPSTTLDPDIATASEDPWRPTATGKQEEFFIEGTNGLLYLGTTPPYDENTKTTVVAEGIAYIPKELDMNQTSTLAGDVLYGDLGLPTPEDTHREELVAEMEANKYGYLIVYLIKLTEIIATKNPEHVSQVIRHAEPILTDLFNNARLAWFGEPLIQVTMNLGMFLSETEMDVIQSYAGMMHQMLKTRKENLAVDVNSIIDYAELLYEDDEGVLLLEVIKEFDEYPNINKTSYELADDLIEYFLSPYRRLYNSERRQALLDSINYALTLRFPNIHRRFNDALVVSSGNGRTPSTRQRFQNFRSITQFKENQKKNIRFKQRTDIKKTQRRIPHSEFNYENILRRKYNLGVDIFPQLRRTKPVTNIQKRFSVITSGQHERFRGLITRSYMNPNTLYVNLAATRPTTDYKTVPSNFFLQRHISDRASPRGYQKQAQSYHRLDHRSHSTVKYVQKDVTSFMNEMKKRFMIAQAKKKAQKLKLKAEVIKRIAEGSSYSDEEASLKMNLIDALLNRNKTKEAGNDTKKNTAEPESESSIRFDKLEAPVANVKDEDNTSEEDRQNGI